jgi:hypothetical protein
MSENQNKQSQTCHDDCNAVNSLSVSYVYFCNSHLPSVPCLNIITLGEEDEKRMKDSCYCSESVTERQMVVEWFHHVSNNFRHLFGEHP